MVFRSFCKWILFESRFNYGMNKRATVFHFFKWYSVLAPRLRSPSRQPRVRRYKYSERIAYTHTHARAVVLRARHVAVPDFFEMEHFFAFVSTPQPIPVLFGQYKTLKQADAQLLPPSSFSFCSIYRQVARLLRFLYFLFFFSSFSFNSKMQSIWHTVWYTYWK